MIEIDDQLRRRRMLASLLGVLAVVFFVWLPSLSGEFVYDDNLLIQRNPALTALSNWPSVVGRGMWSFLDSGDAAHLGYWRPLAGTLLLFTNVLGHNSPLVFHWVVLLLHLAATVAAFMLALELAGSAPVALLTALLFGLHPVHTESVAWISALNDPLFALFAFLALRNWIRWRKAGSEGMPWSAGVLLLLALFSKELGVAVLPLALAYDLATTRKAGPLRAWVPFAAAVFLWYLGRAAVFGELSAGFGRTTTWFGVGPARLAQLRIELFGGYSWLGLWPADLKLFHPFKPELPVSDPLFLRALLCSAALIGAIVWAWKKELRTLAFALLFLPVSILPALASVQSLGISPLAERYLYLGVFGFVFALAWCAWRWLPKALAIAACLVIGTLYSLKAIERTPFWHDEITLFKTLRAQTPEVPEAHWGFGRLLLERYRKSGAVEDLAEATKVFWEGQDLIDRAQGNYDPKHYRPGDQSIFATRNDHIQTGLGIAWCLLYDGENSGEPQNGAKESFEKVVQRYPESDQALVGLASAQIQRGQLDEAEKSLRKALMMNERNVEAHKNLALVLMSRGNLDGAHSEFARALELRPDHLEDLIWIARISLQQGKEEEARAWIARAGAAHPESTAPLVVEATAAAQHQKFDEALKLVDKALIHNADDGEALALKGKLHALRGDKKSARQALGRACELLPTNFEVNYNMGALVGESTPEEALPYLVRAYELRPPGPVGEALRKTLLAMNFRAARIPVDLAKADLARNDVAGAGEWAAKAQTAEPENGEVRLLAGDLAQRRGASAEAEKELIEACKLLPDSIEARLALGQLYISANRNDEARKALEELLAVAKRQGAGAIEDELMRRRARELLEMLRK